MENKKINILHISIADHAGGAAIAANRLHVLMNKNLNLDSKMLVLVKETDNNSIAVTSSFDRNIARVGLYLDKIFSFGRKKELGLFSMAPFGVSVHKHVFFNTADVIYLHWVNNGFLSLREIRLILMLKKPVFFFCHDMWYFSGGCHQSYGCKKFEIGCERCHFFKSNILVDQAKIVYNAKQKIYKKYSENINFIGPSSLWARLASSSKLVQNDQSHFIPNIIDEVKFRPNVDTPINDMIIEKYRVIYGAMGGKSNQYKGWDYFVAAITLLPEHFKDKIEVILFGYDFTEEEMATLPFSATSAGLISDEDTMVKLYQSAHIYVFPSLQESFGQTLMEAMSCGLPAVAFPVGAVEDLVDHLENGYIAKYQDAEDLCTGIMYLADHDKYKTLAKNARKKIINEYSAVSIIARHMNIIRKQLVN